MFNDISKIYDFELTCKRNQRVSKQFAKNVLNCNRQFKSMFVWLYGFQSIIKFEFIFYCKHRALKILGSKIDFMQPFYLFVTFINLNRLLLHIY